MHSTSPHNLHGLLATCALILSLPLSGHGQNITQVNELSAWLLTGYNKHTRPVNDQKANILVDISIDLFSLRDFDEVRGKLSTGMVFHMTWKDESLGWDPDYEFGNEALEMSQDSIWKPALTMENPYNKPEEIGDRNWGTVNVESDGVVLWDPLVILDTTCSVDTIFYPFDIQTCSVVLYTFTYKQGDTIFNLLKPTLDLTYYETHSSWTLLSTSVSSGYEGSRDLDGIMVVRITIKLERKPAFVLVNFLVPILVLALLNPLVFQLPTESGERLSFSITLLLATSVFMTILADYIPRNAEPMSKCAYMLLILYLISSSILLLVIISLKIYFIPETRPVTTAGKAIVCLVGMRFKKMAVSPDIVLKIDRNTESAKEEDDDAVKCTETMETQDAAARDVITWRDVSVAFDKCCFVLVYLAIVLVIGVYLTILRAGAPRESM